MSDRKVIVSDANGTLYEFDFAPIVLPTHDEAMERVNAGNGDHLDAFIWSQEPAGDLGDEFREGLSDAINEILKCRLTKMTEV